MVQVCTAKLVLLVPLTVIYQTHLQWLHEGMESLNAINSAFADHDFKEQALYYCKFNVNKCTVQNATESISDMYFVFCGFHLVFSIYMYVVPSNLLDVC